MKKFTLIIIAAVAIASVAVFGSRYVFAEKPTVDTPESGATSYIKATHDSLVALNHGLVGAGSWGDWGAYWNRIRSAGEWMPDGTAAVSDVIASKTFFNTTRTAQTGTYNASNISAATVKNGTLFGVGLTGDYPSASHNLPGDTLATDAGVTDVKYDLEAWTKTGALVTGTYPNPTSCSGQVHHDAFGDGASAACVSTLNSNNNLTWTTASPAVTGDDASGNGNQDPRTGLIWSQYLGHTGATVNFVASGGNDWSWDGTTDADNLALDAGHRTATLLCSDRGNGWRLPSQKELMQAYIDGSFFKLSSASYTFWAVTENSATTAWLVNLSNGTTATTNKSTSSYYVRCVR